MKNLKKFILQILLIIYLILIAGNIIAKETITDIDISYAVETELLYNATTPSYLIDIETNKGIVTLAGSVDNILAKERAIKIAQTVKGVRAVIDKIEVNAPVRDNKVLENDIVDALFLDPATDSYEIIVNAENGVVTLNGKVDSWQEKQLAAFVAKGVKGVKAVENNIDVDYKANRPDSEIKKDIKESLKNDIRIDDALITVDVKNGKVELSGYTGSANEKLVARAHAWTSGVKSVKMDKLEVTGWAREDKFRKNKYVQKTDEEIKNAIKDAFFYDPRVLSFNPEVTVKDGVVTLSGIVDNLKAKFAAEQDVKNVIGVIRVKNYLKVRPAFIPEDKTLAANVKTALQKDPVIERWEVNVMANNGVVYLNGTVDSYYEKLQAENIASKTKGVIAVENNLKINDDNDYVFYKYYGWNTIYPLALIDTRYAYDSDREIFNNIQSQLWWSPYVNEDEIKVTVDNGIATLEGVVDTEREKLFAEINALEGGAKDVENNLVVEYTP